MTTTLSTRARALAIIAMVAIATGCTAEERFMAAAAQHNQRKELEARTSGSLTDVQLGRLAKCESGGNPRAVSRSGSYMGLYQFDQRTWNGVARRVAPEWSGVRPADAPPEIQHAMARTLFADRGRSPWPVCGRRL